MESLAIALFLYFLLTILSGNKKKNPPKRPPGVPIPPRENPSEGNAGSRRGPLGFEIPPLEGAPPIPGEPPSEEDNGTFGVPEPLGEPIPQGNSWQQYLLGTPSPKAPAPQEPPMPSEPVKEPSSPISLNPQTALQAVALAEVLNRPKAYRHRGRR